MVHLNYLKFRLNSVAAFIGKAVSNYSIIIEVRFKLHEEFSKKKRGVIFERIRSQTDEKI